MPVECLPLEYLQKQTSVVPQPLSITDQAPAVRPKQLSLKDQTPKHALEDKKEPAAKKQEVESADSYDNYDEAAKEKIKALFRKSAALAFQNLAETSSTATSSKEQAPALKDEETQDVD